MNLPTITENKVVDVDYALKEWRAYQRLCKELLDDSDYQEYERTDKKTGKTITKRFPKKSAWAKLGRAFNVKTEIVEKEFGAGVRALVEALTKIANLYTANWAR